MEPSDKNALALKVLNGMNGDAIAALNEFDPGVYRTIAGHAGMIEGFRADGAPPAPPALRRSQMSTDQKIQYIAQHGADGLLQLPE